MSDSAEAATVNIVGGLPPVYARIVEAIGIPPPATVYTWAPTIYSPDGEHIVTPDLLAHEMVHMVQQGEIGGPETWWDRYIADPEWRAQQELAAYREQFAFMKRRIRDRNELARFRRHLAAVMAGPLYGHVMTGSAAYAAIGA